MGAIQPSAGGRSHGQTADDVAELHLFWKKPTVAGQHPTNNWKLFYSQARGAIKVAPSSGDG
jgi:hypothetical protein